MICAFNITFINCSNTVFAYVNRVVFVVAKDDLEGE